MLKRLAVLGLLLLAIVFVGGCHDGYRVRSGYDGYASSRVHLDRGYRHVNRTVYVRHRHHPRVRYCDY